MERTSKRRRPHTIRRRPAMNNTLRIILIILFGLTFIISSYMLVKSLLERQFAIEYYQSMQESYEPNLPDFNPTDEQTGPDNTSGDTPAVTERPGIIRMENPTVTKLISEYPDVVCWITVPGTNISYPVVQAADNDYYLRKDLDGNYLVSGTIFMDYRSNPDFSDAKTLIYGHHMKNGTMFGNIELYNDPAFLSENPDLYIVLPDLTYHYAIYAYMVVGSADNQIYAMNDMQTEKERRDFLTYIRENARYINDDLKPTADSLFLILSTCSYEFDDARMLLICVAN